MKHKFLGAACVGALSAIAIASTASADPQGAPSSRPLAGVGSDTTQNVLNGLSEVVTINGSKVIASYDAIGTNPITTKNPAPSGSNCTFNRPNGSTAGRNALISSLASGSTTAGCIDFARSSSLNLAATPNQLTYIPFAIDGLSFAVTSESDVPRSLTLDELKSIYRCEASSIDPYIPQSGSGSRAFFLSTLGLTEAQVSSSTCIRDNKNGVPLQENDGRALDNNDIFAYSTAAYASQNAGLVADVRGRTVLGVINGVAPLTLNGDFPIKRDVYNIIPTAREGATPTSTVFVGPGSLVCQATGTIRSFGFATNPNCGSTNQRTS